MSLGLYFQIIGHSPYCDQVSWLAHLHPEKFPSAIERYNTNEVRRILGGLQSILSKQPAKAEWLVGDKMAFDDMAFMPWNFRLSESLSLPSDEV